MPESGRKVESPGGGELPTARGAFPAQAAKMRGISLCPQLRPARRAALFSSLHAVRHRPFPPRRFFRASSRLGPALLTATGYRRSHVKILCRQARKRQRPPSLFPMPRLRPDLSFSPCAHSGAERKLRQNAAAPSPRSLPRRPPGVLRSFVSCRFFIKNIFSQASKCLSFQICCNFKSLFNFLFTVRPNAPPPPRQNAVPVLLPRAQKTLPPLLPGRLFAACFSVRSPIPSFTPKQKKQRLRPLQPTRRTRRALRDKIGNKREILSKFPHKVGNNM